MLALYRSGRQAEALDTFDAGRRVLAEELGLEPGTSLRALQAAILAHDPELDHRPPHRRSASATPSRRRLVAAGAALVVAAVSAAVLLGGGEEAGRSAGGGYVVLVDPQSGEVERSVSVGPAPGAVSVGEGAVWALDLDGQTVSRVDPESLEATAFGVGVTPTDVAAGAGAVWVAGGGPVRGASRRDRSPPRWHASTRPPARCAPGSSFRGGALRPPSRPRITWRSSATRSG